MSDSSPDKDNNPAKSTWKSVGIFASIGVVIGIALLVPAYGLHSGDQTLAHHIFRDVGIGFIVAALSVFGYEFVRHVSGAIREAKDFKEASDNILVASTGIQLLVEKAALPLCLERTFAKDKHLRDCLIDLTGFSYQLSRSQDNREYLEFLTWIIKECALTSAEKLTGLRESIENEIWNKEFSYPMLDNRTIVARLLRMQFQKLDKDDQYDSITNALFYDDRRLTEFENAIERAKEKGVKIRRLFNVTNFEDDAALIGSTEKFGEAKEVVQRHLALAKENPQVYEVRFLGQNIYSAAKIRFAPEYHFLDRLPRSYFGLFRFNSKRHTVVFSPKNHKSLSEIEMMALNSDLPRKVFDGLWNICAGAPNPFLAESFDKAWADNFVKNLGATP